MFIKALVVSVVALWLQVVSSADVAQHLSVVVLAFPQASHHGYSGPIDGVLGTQSWAGTQRGLADYGYTGPADGVPGTNTYMAMQRLASHYGYTGPIDGVMGGNSYRGVATYFNTL